MGRRGVWAAVLAGMLGLPSLAAAQNRQISGTVTRANGNTPISEATVTQVGGGAVARTTTAGKFVVTVSGGDVRLSVRAIGYQRRELIVPAGQSTVNIALTEDVFKLDEVVTTGQATTLERRNATTAPVTVGSDEITRAPSSSLEQALQGKVPGAVISMNGGQPGGGGQIQIRGVTTILGNGQPLIVVDGVIYSNDGFSAGANAVTGAAGGGQSSNQDAVVNRLADINPSEIESIEILKSAAATAIYGSRATNGVVVIKTKRGTPGQSRFNVTQRVGVSDPLRTLGFRKFTSVNEVVNDTPYGQIGPNAVTVLNNLYPTGVIPLSANNDFEAQLYSKRKPSYETTASIAGGSETSQYFVSATNRQESGLAINTGARLQSLRMNVDQAWGKRWKTSVSLNVTRSTSDRGLSNNDNTFTSPIYNFGYTPAVFPLNTQDAQGNYFENPIFGGGNATSNPFQTFRYLKLTEDVFRQTGSVTQNFQAVQTDQHMVSLDFLGGFDRFQDEGTLVSPSFLQYEGSDGYFGRTQASNTESLNYQARLTGTWTFTPSKAVSFSTTAGGEYAMQQINQYRQRARGILPGTTLTAQGTIDNTAAYTKFNDQSVFVTEQILALDNKLAINGGVRGDRSSANGNVSKFYLFPRASASYNIDNLGVIDNVKFRGGYGQTGNRPRFGDRDITLAAGSNIGGVATVIPSTLVGNPTIRPETLNEFEGGTDLTMFKQRVQVEATYYKRTITNLLLQPAVAPSTGVTNTVINGGKLRSEGFEGSITFVPVNTADLVWTFRATFQKNKQRIVELPSTVPTFVVGSTGFGSGFGRSKIKSGEVTTAIWGNGLVDPATGKFVPVGCKLDGSCPTAVSKDTVIGDANPNFTMYFNNSITYKAVTLSFTVDWRKGGDLSVMSQNLNDEGATSRDYTTPLTSANLPTKSSGVNIANLPTSDQRLGAFRYDSWRGGGDARAYITDGSFVRLRDIGVTYEMPKQFAKTIGANTMRLNAQARNVLLFSKYWGFDPEFNNFGNQNVSRFVDLAPYPGARQFAVSVDVGF